MVIWWGWDKKWGTQESFVGWDTELCFTFVISKLSSQKCWRCEMECMPEQRETNRGLTNRFTNHLHKNSTWPCVRRGGQLVIRSKATQYWDKLKEGAMKNIYKTDDARSWSKNCSDRELCTNGRSRNYDRMVNEWCFIYQEVWGKRLWSLIKKSLF